MTNKNLNDIQPDNLCAIYGIGKVTEQLLNQSLGIYSYQDLMVRSADEIAAELKASGGSTSINKVEEWRMKAREFANSQGRDDLMVARIEDKEPESASASQNWNTLAKFVVEFQSYREENGVEQRRTMCQQHEAEEKEFWPGIDCIQPCQWMQKLIENSLKPIQQESHSIRKRSAESTISATESLPAEPQNAKPLSVKVDITHVRAFQLSVNELPQAVANAGGIFSGIVSSDQPVSFEVSFQISGSDVEDMSKSHPLYNTEVYAYNRTTSEKKHLTAAKPGYLEQGKLSYKMILPESVLSSGNYRLEYFTRLEGEHPAEGHLAVPFLRVA